MADVRVASPTTAPPATKASPARDAILELKARIGKSVLGQDHLVEGMLIGLLANGNLLIESLPGLAKTRAVKTLAKNLAVDLSRVQFTPDLLPSDVTGAEIEIRLKRADSSSSRKGRFSPISFWLTKSTGHQQRCSQRCLRRWKNARLPLRAKRTKCLICSWCSLPRTRLSRKVRTLFPRRSSIAFSCTSWFPIRMKRQRAKS